MPAPAPPPLVGDLVDLWSDLNPAAGYTAGHLDTIPNLFFQTDAAAEAMRGRIARLRARLGELDDHNLRVTAGALLSTLGTTLDLARPSGAGPSGTGAGGVRAAADGVFYTVLKGDAGRPWVPDYLDIVRRMVEFETRRWWGGDFPALLRKECLDTAGYLEGTLAALRQQRPDVGDAIDAILAALIHYRDLFFVEGIDDPDFAVCWKVFAADDAARGPQRAAGYPDVLQRHYQLTRSAHDIDAIAEGWLELDLPVTISLAERIVGLGLVGDIAPGPDWLERVWDAVGRLFGVTVDEAEIRKVDDACRDFGEAYIIGFDPEADRIEFAVTPDYLENLVTGGEDFAVDALDPASVYSQLYLTRSKNTSLLTMINILVHEASHGYDFVLGAKHAGSPLYNVDTALEVAMTEGMAFYREYQYWAAAADLLGRPELDAVQRAYLDLYVPPKQAALPRAAQQPEIGVLCAQLETWIWRVVRYIRALCDTRVNGGRTTYTAFIEQMAQTTGLSRETLHGECATFMAMPGYAPCYAVGGAAYAMLQKQGIARGISEKDFNTTASRQGFPAWPVALVELEAYIAPTESAK